MRTRFTALTFAGVLAFAAVACDDSGGDVDDTTPEAPDGVTTTEPLEPGGAGDLGTPTPTPDVETGGGDVAPTE